MCICYSCSTGTSNLPDMYCTYSIYMHEIGAIGLRARSLSVQKNSRLSPYNGRHFGRKISNKVLKKQGG